MPATETSRPSQKRNTHGDSRRVTGTECESVARDALALYPDMPALELAGRMAEFADPEFIAALDAQLRTRFWVRTILELRARERREKDAQDWLFPAIQEITAKLPARIPVGNKKTVPRGQIVYENLEQYLKVLNRRDRERHKKRIAAVLALMKLWPARSKKTQGITLSEVDRNKALHAGLI